MSEIEETLERIKGHAGVEAYVIINNDGEVLRKMPGLATEKAKDYGDEVTKLAKKARHVVRDLDPKVSARVVSSDALSRGFSLLCLLTYLVPDMSCDLQNDLQFLRLRTRDKEALIAPGTPCVR